MIINPLFVADFYKCVNRNFYPSNTTLVYSNYTARSDKHVNICKDMWTGQVVFFGLQYYIKKFLIDQFHNGFFNRPEGEAVGEYARRMDTCLGPGAVTTDHIRALHRLGYLPISIQALPEGTLCPIGVPMLTIYNTKPEYFWLTNYLETSLSSYLWPMITAATTAYHYKKFLVEAANRTGGNLEFVNWQGHDFSARGMMGGEAPMMTGAGHLTSFTGTDTVSAIDLLERYYQANGLIGGSVPASEHSQCSAYGFNDELEGYYRRNLTEVYPKGIVSLVSDTYDFFKVITDYMPILKDVIMARDGKCVLRPDSGLPEHILCGNPNAVPGSPENKGAVQLLWEIFGGTVNSKGYKELDSHIGLIYGDSITPERCYTIINRLAEMGFASTSVVFGIGSFTYQFCSRDSLSQAIKATYCEIDNKPQIIFKNPKTDAGDMSKKSLRGCVIVTRNDEGKLTVRDGLTLAECTAGGGLLEPVFRNGNLLRSTTLSEIRQRLSDSLKLVASQS